MPAAHEDHYIEPVKLLGTTWYRRGPAYWTRRVALSFGYLLLAAGSGAVSVLVVRSFWVDRGPTAVAIGATVVGVVATVWTAVLTVRAYRRAERSGRPRRPTARRTGLLGLRENDRVCRGGVGFLSLHRLRGYDGHVRLQPPAAVLR